MRVIGRLMQELDKIMSRRKRKPDLVFCTAMKFGSLRIQEFNFFINTFFKMDDMQYVFLG